MKEISQEIIEINGQEYKLFLNRQGIVAYEKFCKEEAKQLEEIRKKHGKTLDEITSDEVIEINEDTNPFEGLEDFDEIDSVKNMEIVRKLYIKLYWIMLYENHKLSLNQVEELYKQAIEEYGDEQLQALADQMVEEANVIPKSQSKENLKNLKALKPKK